MFCEALPPAFKYALRHMRFVISAAMAVYYKNARRMHRLKKAWLFTTSSLSCGRDSSPDAGRRPQLYQICEALLSRLFLCLKPFQGAFEYPTNPKIECRQRQQSIHRNGRF